MKRVLLFMALVGVALTPAVLLGQSAQVVVTGVVVDNLDNLGLPGVTVSVGSPERALTSTDANGEFSVRVARGSTLHFHLIGFIDRSVTLKSSQTNIQVTLTVD